MARDLKDPDLEDFLRRVDELESVVKGETVPEGNDASTQREPVDRTVINRSAFKDDSRNQGAPSPASQSQDGFMRAVEADANERAEKRRKRKEEATALKEEGNREFKKGNYSHAVEFYTQGLDRLKDFVVLYTNRAQAYNKLGKYAEAINDCNTALRLEPNNIKALVHLGKAHQGLGDYDAAIKTFQEILKIDGKREKMVQDYVKAAQLAQSMSVSASEAEKLSDQGDTRVTGVHQIVDNLKRQHQPVAYYAAEMQILSLMLNDDSSRAQFRTFGGFNLLKNNKIVQWVLTSAANKDKNLTSSENELVCATFDLLTSAVTANEENSAHLVNLSELPTLLVDIFSKGHGNYIQDGCLILLSTLSKNPAGCTSIVEHFNVFSLTSAIMSLLVTLRAELIVSQAVDLLGNIRQDERFVQRFMETNDSTDFEEVLSPFEKHLRNHSKMPQMAVLESIYTMLTLSSDSLLIRCTMGTEKVLSAIVYALERYTEKQSKNITDKEIPTVLMCLLTNIFAERCPMGDLGMKDGLKSLLKVCVELLENSNKELWLRAVKLLSRILPSTNEGVLDVTKQNIVPKIVHLMKNEGENFNNHALKCLAVLTQQSERAAKDLVKSDKELEYVCGELNGDKDSNIANAALVIGNCTRVAGFSTCLANSDIIKTLLSKTDTTSGAVKENCAIALAKLATTDERHLDQLRKLGGIGILHSCMKYVNT